MGMIALVNAYRTIVSDAAEHPLMRKASAMSLVFLGHVDGAALYELEQMLQSRSPADRLAAALFLSSTASGGDYDERLVDELCEWLFDDSASESASTLVRQALERVGACDRVADAVFARLHALHWRTRFKALQCVQIIAGSLSEEMRQQLARMALSERNAEVWQQL